MSKRGIKLLTGFSGCKEIVRRAVDLPAHDVMLMVGMLDAVVYTAHCGNKEVRYVHDFDGASRPALAVSDDGRQLYIIAGNYTFTERGIENV